MHFWFIQRGLFPCFLEPRSQALPDHRCPLLFLDGYASHQVSPSEVEFGEDNIIYVDLGAQVLIWVSRENEGKKNLSFFLFFVWLIDCLFLVETVRREHCIPRIRNHPGGLLEACEKTKLLATSIPENPFHPCRPGEEKLGFAWLCCAAWFE